MTQDDIEADKLCHQLSVGVLRQGQGDTARVRYGGQAMMRLRRASVIGFSLLTSARDGICRLRVGVVVPAIRATFSGPAPRPHPLTLSGVETPVNLAFVEPHLHWSRRWSSRSGSSSSTMSQTSSGCCWSSSPLSGTGTPTMSYRRIPLPTTFERGDARERDRYSAPERLLIRS